MKTIIILLCCIFAGITVHAQSNNGIKFEEGSFSEALVKAQLEKKLIFIDCYTDWCKPCKEMALNVFPNDTVGTFFNANFINIKLNMEDTVNAKNFAKDFGVWCYPTYLFIDSDSNVIHRFSSKLSVVDFVNFAKDALNPERQFTTFKSKYESGTMTADECLEYILMRRATCLQSIEELEYYLNTQDEENFSNRANWNVLQMFTIGPDSRIFQYLLGHRSEFDMRYSKDSVSEVISTVYRREFSKYLRPGKTQDTLAYRALRTKIIELQIPESEKLVLIGDLFLYYNTSDWEAYAPTAIRYVNGYIANDDFQTLNNLAWYFYLHVDNQDHLDIATTWIQQSLQAKTAFFNTDTYAGLLYKRGRYKEALEQVDNAIRLAKTEGVTDYSGTETLKKKIEVALGIQ